ncbi:MAG: hypothetical protein AB7S70_11510, partial [Hyphomicrobium sp.]
FEDNKLNFRSCDGQNITARWRGANFSLSLPGKSLGDDHETFAYVGWDGRCLTGRWDAEAHAFKLASDETTIASAVLRFVSWDGSKWAGVRTGGGFFVARVADENEEVSPSQLAEIASGLERRNAAFSPGAALADALKDATVP